MLEDPQSPRYAQRRTHRTYTSQFKAELVSICQKPGASIAAVALQHGMNDNLLDRWRKEWTQGLHRRVGRVTTVVATPETPAFVPIELSPSASITTSEQSCVAASTQAADIRLRSRCDHRRSTDQVPRNATEQRLAGTEANHLGFGIVQTTSTNLFDPTKKGNLWGKRERYAWVG
jgi:transposase-like protein